MMNCPFCCNQEIPEDSDLCPHCGKSLKMVCSACHQVVEEFGYPQYKLCLECSALPCQHNEEDYYPDERQQDEEDDVPFSDDQPDEESEEPDEYHEVNLGDNPGGLRIYE